jgi:hypothetical protein
MKPKALKKGLVLNKKTIADLSEAAMGKVDGGIQSNDISKCNTYCISNCECSIDVCIFTDHIACDPTIPKQH